MPASHTFTLLACSALALLSCLGSVAARPGIFNAAKGIQIKVIANPGNSCADVGEGQTCACACDRPASRKSQSAERVGGVPSELN